MNYSKTYAGAIVQMLTFVAASLNIDLPATDAEAIVYGLIALGSFLLTLYGRFVAKEKVTLLGSK